AIVMNKDDFEQGMDHNQAVEKGEMLSGYEQGIKITDDTWSTIESNSGERMNPWLINNSDHTISYKPEEGSNSINVGPNKDVYARIDGVAAPHFKRRTGV
ncbi:MAG: hypothetical protein ACOC3T_02870, partial [Bacteroidota bacterium]